MIPLKQIPAVLAIFLVGSLSSIGYGQADPVPQEASDPKGAIIIASIEGKVTVTNNKSGADLPAPLVVAGKILFDGHTIKTGPNGKIILLFSTGTVTTLKADSTLNIKKFTQGKIPAGTNLNTIKEEPSASDVLIDLNVGDMVVDIKKLKKESSFDIDSPVGTAGIRGTRVGMNIRPAAGGGWMSKITVPRGAISFTPLAILGAPPPIPVPVLAGQAVAPAVTDTGAVAAAPVAAPAAAGDLAAINADLDDAGAAANNAIDNVAPVPGDGPDAEDAPEKDGEEEAPAEEEINEEDDERQAASKGVDENSSSEAVALDKAGLIDLDNPEQLEQVETFVEVTDKAATMFKEYQDEEASANSENTNAAQRRAGGESDSESFLNNLIKPDETGKLPLADVVDVTESAESVGANDDSTLSAVLDNAEKAADLKVVIAAAEKADSKDQATLGAVLRNAEQGDKLAAVVATADVVDSESGAADAGSERGASVGEKQKKKLDSLFKVVKQVDEVQVKEKKKKDAAKIATAAAKAEGKNDAEIAAAGKSAEDAVVAAAADEAKKEAEATAKAAGKSAVEIAAAGVAAQAEEEKSIENSVGGKEVDTFASDIFTQLEDVVDLTETATEIGTDAGFGEVLKNADKADKLVKVVDAAKGAGADDSLAAVLKSADKAVQMEEIVATENAKKKKVEDDARAAGKSEFEIAAEMKIAEEASAKKASALFKVVKKVDDNKEEVKAAPTTTDGGEGTPVVVALNADDIFGKLGDVVKLTETATTLKSDAGFDSILENPLMAQDLVKVVDAAKDLFKDVKGEGASDSLSLEAVLKSADQADKLAAVVKKAREIDGGAESGAEQAKLGALFDVVKKVEDAKETAKTAAPGAAGAVNVSHVFANIEAVVELAETAADAATNADGVADEAAKSAFLNNVFKVADKARELQAVVQAAASAQGDTANDQANAQALGSILSLATDETRVAALVNVAGIKTTIVDGVKVVQAKEIAEEDVAAHNNKLSALLAVVEKVDAAAEAGSTDISADAVFTNIELVVGLAEDTGTNGITEADRTLALNSVLKTAKNENAAQVLQAARDVADKVKAAGADDYATNLANVLKYAETADKLLAVADAAGDGADLGNLFANAEHAAALATVVEAAGETAKKKAQDTARAAGKSDEDIKTAGEDAGTGDLGKLLENAEHAVKLATVVKAAKATADKAKTAAEDTARDLGKSQAEIDAAGEAAGLTDLGTLLDVSAENIGHLATVTAAANDAAIKAEDAARAAGKSDEEIKAAGLTDLGNLLEYAEDAEHLATVTNAAKAAADKAKQKAIDEGKTDAEIEAAGVADLGSLLANAGQAKDLADIVRTDEQAKTDAKQKARDAGQSEAEIAAAGEAVDTTDLGKLLDHADQAGELAEMTGKAEERARKKARDEGKTDAEIEAAGKAARDKVLDHPDQAKAMKDMADAKAAKAKKKAEDAARAEGKTDEEIATAGESAATNVDIDELLENPDQAAATKKLVDDAEAAADAAAAKAKKDAEDVARAEGKSEEEIAAAGDAAEEAVPDADIDILIDNAGQADDLKDLDADLLAELTALGLTGDDLKKVTDDLKAGPDEGQQPGDAPTNQPVDPNTVSLLANHEIKGNAIDPNLVLNAELAFASSFFKDVAQVYDSLSGPSDAGESTARNFNLLGGKNVSISAGNYDIGNVYGGPGKDEFLIAATDKLTIAGNAAFRNTDESTASTTDGLILLSAGSVSLPQGNGDQRASVSYAGDMLGIGSLETLNVISVDLQAEGEVSLRSLDSLVIENSSLRTTGNGADFVHLRALDEINANGLLFSANVQKIVMDAMTINLANLTFPGGSTVNLNSTLGPLDNKYPTFGSSNQKYGRVNFINNVRYGQHLLNSRSAFDTHGGSISIGTK
jgi:hypothetical protein